MPVVDEIVIPKRNEKNGENKTSLSDQQKVIVQSLLRRVNYHLTLTEHLKSIHVFIVRIINHFRDR